MRFWEEKKAVRKCRDSPAGMDSAKVSLCCGDGSESTRKTPAVELCVGHREFHKWGGTRGGWRAGRTGGC